jgi:hypothetical protein
LGGAAGIIAIANQDVGDEEERQLPASMGI